MICRNVILFHSTCILTLAISSTNAASFKLTNLRCMAPNPSVGAFQKCSMKAVKRDVVEINVYFSMVQKPLRNCTLFVRLMKRGNHAHKALYHFNVDLCAFLGNSRRNPWASLFYNLFDFKKYSNLNHSCPLDHDMIVNRCRVNTNPLNILAIAYDIHELDVI